MRKRKRESVSDKSIGMEGCMKKYYLLFVGIWCLGFAVIGLGGLDPVFDYSVRKSIHAAGKSSKELEEEIQKKSQEQQSAVTEKKKLQQEIATIEEKKENVSEYIEELDKKSDELAEKIVKNREKIGTLKIKVKALRSEKKQTEAKKNIQYDAMKQRIKYMYENGNEDYVELILGSESLSDFFNRTEYVARVTDYDKNLLGEYQKTCKALETAEKKIEQKLDELELTKAHLQVEKSSVAELVTKKQEEIADYQELIANKNTSLGDTEVLLASQENELEKLMAAQRAARAAEEKKKQEAAREAAKKAEEKKETPKFNDIDAEPAEEERNTGGYGWPLAASGRISSTFGYRTSPTKGASTYHKGVDIAVPVGTAVLATKAGTVITATYSASAGNYVAISHGEGVYSYYMHCSGLNVRSGQSVSAGQQIALSGNTGISTGPHLHFGLFMNGGYVNPLNYVSR